MPCASLVLALALALVAAAPAAAAQDLPPSLTADTVFALAGVEQVQLPRRAVATTTRSGAAIDPALGRSYSVGRTRDARGRHRHRDRRAPRRRLAGPDLRAATARWRCRSRRVNDDYGVALAVLPDHRLRVLGATDVRDARRTSTWRSSACSRTARSTPTSASAGLRRRLGRRDDAPARARGRPRRRGSRSPAAPTARGREHVPRRSRRRRRGRGPVRVLDRGGRDQPDRGVGVAWRDRPARSR